MVLTITLNPCIDKSSRVANLQPEAKLRCSEIVYEPGGGGINVSKALLKLDISSTALFPSGGHNGNMLNELLRKAGIKYHAVKTEVETRENWVMQETFTNRQYRFTFPGLPLEDQIIETLIDQLHAFVPEFVVASGSIPQGVSDNIYASIAAAANAIGAKYIVDTSGPALQAIKGKGAFLIKPNLGELCAIIGIDRIEEDEVPAAAAKLISEGYAEMVAVSMGPKGAWLVDSTGKDYVLAPTVEKKSTVGAGDSMLAGMLYMQLKGASRSDTLKFGVACGTAATMNEGTHLFDSEQAFKLFAELR